MHAAFIHPVLFSARKELNQLYHLLAMKIQAKKSLKNKQMRKQSKAGMEIMLCASTHDNRLCRKKNKTPLLGVPNSSASVWMKVAGTRQAQTVPMTGVHFVFLSKSSSMVYLFMRKQNWQPSGPSTACLSTVKCLVPPISSFIQGSWHSTPH